MKRITLSIMIITVISKLVGFIREMSLSYVYGASGITDAYLISQTIPTVVFSFISAGVRPFVPYSVLSRTWEAGSRYVYQ